MGESEREGRVREMGERERREEGKRERGEREGRRVRERGR